MGIFLGDIYSESLRMTTQLKVIFPDLSNDVTPIIEGEPCVLYLLHGLGGNAGEWTRFSKIEYYAKKYNFIIIMPEVQRSFYCDTAFGPNYYTYVAEELPAICQRWLNVTKAREKTFIAGESMGGYGAVKIGLRNKKKYAAIGSLSGVLDFKRIVQDIMENRWEDISPREMVAVLGTDTVVKPEDDVLYLVKEAAKCADRPKLIQICGTEDFLYPDNQLFHNTVQEAGFKHTYMEWEGEHAWPFWDTAIQRVFQFFCGMDIYQSPIF